MVRVEKWQSLLVVIVGRRGRRIGGAKVLSGATRDAPACSLSLSLLSVETMMNEASLSLSF